MRIKQWALFVTSLFFLFISCDHEDGALEKEILKIPIEFKVLRYDKAFFEATPEDLPKLKKDFPYLFPKEFPDELWREKIQDTLVHSLVEETVKNFENFSPILEDLKYFFQHAKYYFPKMRQPDVVTVISEVDYNSKVIYTDSLLLISLDNYLGSTHKYYEGIYDYIRQNMNPPNIVSDVANNFAEKVVALQGRNFLSHLLYEGKKLYITDLLIPKIPAHIKIGYTEEQFTWVERNEENMWKYFVEKELLYSTDSNLQNRFLFPAPYSKFYLSIDQESPPRIGQYIGWKIVRSYMLKFPKTSLEELLRLAPEELFNNAKYKPDK